MARLIINDIARDVPPDVRLIDYLREILRLTSVKDGCSEGACGTCTVLVDGKATKACIAKAARFEGKRVTTVEGLTVRERQVFAYAFAEEGAVQCGFCIPGMILCAKALIDAVPDPTRAQVKAALRGNICRCTGYQQIETAILRAAKMLREDIPVPQASESGALGEPFRRVDAIEKALGLGQFADDLILPGMIYGKALRSRYPRAVVEKIDLTKARLHPDVVAILLAKDVPFNKTGHLIPDWDVLIAEGDTTRYIGDAVALVAARTRASLDEILALIEVTYRPLQPITNPADALKPDAPKLHAGGNLLSRQELRRGDVDAAIARAAHVVTAHYSTPMTDHAFMEPECAVCEPDGQGGVVLYTGSQSVYDEQREVARMLKLPPDKVRSVSMLVGGGFGGKEDMSVQHHAALLAYATGLPVKVRFSRQESLEIHTKRHAMEIDMTTACDADGNLLAMRAYLLSDCGAYASLGGPVLQRACTHAGGPYHFQNIEIVGECAYTNNVPGGAFRGFGVTQSCFAAETNLNRLAELVGISAWEIRHRNAILPGEVLPNGQVASPDTAYRECLEAVKSAYDEHPYAGIAGCMKNSGLGVGVPDIGRCSLLVAGGKVQILTSAACMGQGIATVATQIVATTAHLDPSQIVYVRPDTARTPNSGTSTASRQTLFMGEAARRAAEALRSALHTSSLAALEGRRFDGEYEGVTDRMGSDKENPVSHVAYSYAAQVVIMDERKRVTGVVAAHDVGTIVNPQSCTGQVCGGVVMGLGFGLTEQFVMQDGYVRSKYGTLGLLRSTDAPPIEVRFVHRDAPGALAFGAKGVGEISAIPTAAAAAHAAKRVDGVWRNALPVSDTAYRPKNQRGTP